MRGLEQEGKVRLHIAPSQTVTPTRKYQCVVFALVINAKLQLKICRGRRDWFPFSHLIILNVSIVGRPRLDLAQAGKASWS